MQFKLYLSFLRKLIFRLPFKKSRRTKGFTLLELMIVVAIIGTLAAIAIPNYIQFRERARYAQVITELKQIERQVIAFYILNNNYPNNLTQLGLGIPQDPWGNPYQYLDVTTAVGKGKCRKDHNTNPVNLDFDLYSMGPDGKSKAPFTADPSKDDIVRANNGSFFGRVSDY